jgi:hypothetical protein
MVDREPLSWSPPRQGGLAVGVAFGLLIALAIVATYGVARHLGVIDARMVAERAARTGLNQLEIYFAGAIYWITANSLMEEYVWRWFVFRKCEVLLGGKMAVMAVMAVMMMMMAWHGSIGVYGASCHCAGGTIQLGHHIAGIVASLGVLSLCLYRWCDLELAMAMAIFALCAIAPSIWPGYISHKPRHRGRADLRHRLLADFRVKGPKILNLSDWALDMPSNARV